MDDDSIPAPDALEVFLRAAEYLDSSDMNSDEMAADAADGYRWGFLSGRVLWRDGTSCKMNEQRQTVFRDVSNYDRPLISVSMASFVSLFINAQVVREVGLPLREFFIWTDDWEYTRRISRRYPCWLVPASTVVHDTTRNSGAEIASASAEDIWRFRYMYRNDVYLYRREGIRGYAYQAARLPVHAMRILLSRNPASEKRRRIRIIIRSTAEGIRFHPVPDRV